MSPPGVFPPGYMNISEDQLQACLPLVDTEGSAPPLKPGKKSKKYIKSQVQAQEPAPDTSTFTCACGSSFTANKNRLRHQRECRFFLLVEDLRSLVGEIRISK